MLALALALPFAIPLWIEKIKAGFLCAFDSFEATIPITPSCQFSPQTITALSFLLSKTSYAANESLSLLDELNNYRKTLQEEISKKAEAKTDIKDNAVVDWGENWHEGVIGIVASKL